jgi:hypothetical protein
MESHAPVIVIRLEHHFRKFDSEQRVSLLSPSTEEKNAKSVIFLPNKKYLKPRFLSFLKQMVLGATKVSCCCCTETELFEIAERRTAKVAIW